MTALRSHAQPMNHQMHLLDWTHKAHAQWETKAICAGEQVQLRITDETMTPVEHAEKLYKRAAKQRRAVEKLQPLVSDAEALLAYVEEVRESVALLDRFAPVTLLYST